MLLRYGCNVALSSLQKLHTLRNRLLRTRGNAPRTTEIPHHHQSYEILTLNELVDKTEANGAELNKKP